VKSSFWWVVASALAMTACGSRATQVIVTIDAEPGVRIDSERLHVVVLGGLGRTTAPTASRFDRVLTPGEGDAAYPFKLALAPLDGDVGRSYSVTATAETTTGTFVGQARIIGGYVDGETLRVRLVLEDACRGVTCGDDQTCAAGVCVDARTGGDVDAGVPDDGGPDANRDAEPDVDGGVSGITLRGDFVSGAASGNAGGVTLRGAFDWTGNVSGSAGGVTLRGRVH
jgi:hypothetical protein